MTRTVFLSREAREDLRSIYGWIADRTGTATAERYTARLRAYLAQFERFPRRGYTRDDLRPGLRIVGFERRLTVAFEVTGTRVVILRLLWGGRNLEDAFGP